MCVMSELTLFGSAVDQLVESAEGLFRQIDALPLEDRVRAVNGIREALHRHSPFAAEPVDCVLWVPADRVVANGYNPNSVAPPEMKLLEHSIRQDGYTQPVVVYPEPLEGRDYTVVDGYHRTRVCRESRAVQERVHGYLPVAPIKTTRHDLKDRMAATIRHNRARGVHGVEPMVDIVGELMLKGWTDEEVARELGMDADEVLRFKQHTGLPEIFRGHQYSRAWE